MASILIPFQQNYIVEIFNYPLCTVHPTSDLFLLPTSTAVKPLLHSDLRRISELLLLHSKVIAHQVLRSQ